MTKRHFEAFARRIAADVKHANTLFPAECKAQLATLRYAANLFADIAQSDNPRFDRDRFLSACGLR